MATVSEILVTTHERREKKVSDLITDNIPLFSEMKKRGRIKVINGGRVIWEPVRIAQNQYVQRIDPTEEIALGYNQTLSQFEYSPKIIVVPVVINALEKAQNQGDAREIDLLDERLDVAESSLMNNMELDIQGDGTGFGGKAFAGIQSYITTSTSTGTVGGLARSTYSAIRNTAINAVSLFGSATDSSNIESRLRYARNSVVNGSMSPNFLLCGSTYFNAIGDAMSAKQRFTRNEELAKAGFANYEIEGMTAVLANGKVFSGLSRIAADRCYGLTLESFSLKMYKGFNFQPQPERVSINQLVDVSIMVGIGQFTTNNPAHSFVMYDS